MPRTTNSALRIVGTTLAALLAAVAVAASALYVLVGTRAGTALLVPRVLEAVNGAILGTIEVESFRLRSRGVVELEGVRIRDPAGRVVVAADRARASLDVLLLRLRVVAAEVEVERPDVLLVRTDDGGVTLAQAFRARHPSPEKEEPGESRWTVRLDHLAIRDGAVELVDEDGARRMAARAIALDGEAATSRSGSEAQVHLRGELLAPIEEPISLEAVASLRGGVAEVPRLAAAVGGTRVDAVGEWDLAARAGRVAVRSLAVDARALAEVVPGSPLAGNVSGSLFGAAADGVLTVAFDLAQQGAGGTAIGAAALAMASPLRLGFELDLERLDPAAVVAAAPQGEVSLHARGGLTGTELATMTASLDLEAAPSVVRGARVGPLKLGATARGGVFRVGSLDATVPGARVRGRGSYTLRGGALAAGVRLDASDLATAARAVERVAQVKLPSLAGRASLEGEVAGSARAPRAAFGLSGPRLAVAGVAAEGLALRGELAGTIDRPKARATGSARVVRAGGEVFRTVELTASIDDRAADARVEAVTLRVGPDPLTVAASGILARDWGAVRLSALSVAWPGTEYALTAPARVVFSPPSADRLELASGETRIALEGGLERARSPRPRSRPITVADARLTATGIDLATLPRELLPPDLGVAGVVDLEAQVTGPLTAPEVDAHATVAGGAVAAVSGLAIDADASWDGAARRARVTAVATRVAGGELELRADLPAALARAGRAEAVAVWLRARAIPLGEMSRLAGLTEEVTGAADVEATLSGTAGAPVVSARATLSAIEYSGYGPYRLAVGVDAPGQVALLSATAGTEEETALRLGASVPLDLARFLRDPARGARALLDAPLTGEAQAPEFDLARLAGDFGLPTDLAGGIRGGADLGGTIRAPRGSVALEASGVAAYGYRDAALQLALLLSDDATGLAGSIGVGGEEVVQLSGFLGSAVERLTALGRIETAPLDVDVIVPASDLALAGGRVPLAGRIEGHVALEGTLQRPALDLALDGEQVRISGKPLGDVTARAKAAGTALSADVRIGVATGGELTAALRSTVEISLAALRRGDLAHAPSELEVVADRVDLGVLPALLPGTVRSASGELGADLAAKGPLAALRPIGKVRITGGRAAIAEMGEWSGIELGASLTEDAFLVDRLHAERGRGTLDGRIEARGLAGMAVSGGKPADLTAELRTRSLTIASNGQDLATLDLEARAKGTLDTRRLEAEVTIPRGTVELPERSPREVQSLERRDDIVIVSAFGKPKEAPAGEEREGPPYRVTLRVLVPSRFFVTSVNPRMNIELQADATFDVVGSQTYAEGRVEVLRGYVEPIGGRNFTLERGRVTFTGSAPSDAVLDIVAHYENPSADVTVTVSGTTKEPLVKMSSDPPMDDAQIAMLIATGRTELKAGSGGVGTLTGEEAGRAAAGAVATQLFRNVIADRLPVDSVALSSSEIRAGKYVTDKIYVGYTRNFEAQPEEGENTNEVRVEYQISPRWTLESRYGDARTGGASLIWSKDY